MNTRPSPIILAGATLLLTGLQELGCSKGPPVKLVPVRGTVRFTDGTIPQGEVATVFFEPVGIGAPPASPGMIRKVAFGDIHPQTGSFELTTVSPGDGAIPGQYKVVFHIYKTYLGRESLIPEKYTRTDSTPFEVTVEPGCGPFTFELPKSTSP